MFFHFRLAQHRVATAAAAQAIRQAQQQQQTPQQISSSVPSSVVQAALSAAQPHPQVTAQVQQQQHQQQAVVVGISGAGQQAAVQPLIQRQQASSAPVTSAPLAVQEILRATAQGPAAAQQQQPTVVVSSQQQPSVVTVANLTPQIQQKLVGVTAGGQAAKPVAISATHAPTVSQSFVQGNVVLGTKQAATQQQLNLLRQTALLKKQQQQQQASASPQQQPQDVAKARLQTLQPTTVPPGSVAVSSAQARAGAGGTVQTVSLANVPVTAVMTTTMGGAVTVVTQAMAGGQPKAHLIRQASPAQGCKVSPNY